MAQLDYLTIDPAAPEIPLEVRGPGDKLIFRVLDDLRFEWGSDVDPGEAADVIAEAVTNLLRRNFEWSPGGSS